MLRSATEPGPERLLEELVEGGMVDSSGGRDPPHEERRGPRPRDHPASPPRGGASAQPVRSGRPAAWKTAPASSSISSPSPWSRACAPFSATPRLPARPPDPERGVLRPDPDGDPPPRHAPDRGVLGATVRIVFITPRSKKRLESSPPSGSSGSRVRLLQRNPSFVLEIGQTTVAVDRDITDEIYVKPT